MKIVEYLSSDGVSHFHEWFEGLDSRAAAKVTTSLIRLEMGNTSNVESVGGGVNENKIDYGPGYRVYFGMDVDKLVVLPGGVKKSRQKILNQPKDDGPIIRVEKESNYRSWKICH